MTEAERAYLQMQEDLEKIQVAAANLYSDVLQLAVSSLEVRFLFEVERLSRGENA